MKVRILASIALITTLLTAEMIKFLQAAKPDALTLKDEKGNPLFVAAVGDKPGISEYGIVISAKRDIALQFDKPVTPEVINKDYGVALLRLQALERQAVEAYEAEQARLGGLDFETIE